MAVLLTSGELAEIISRFRSKNEDIDSLKAQLIGKLSNLISLSSLNCPMYLREDARQEITVCIYKDLDRIAKAYNSGEIKADLIVYFRRAFDIIAKKFRYTNRKADSKMVRIDDVFLELVVYPKTYEKSKLLKKVRHALEDFYASRYGQKAYATRASRFAYAILNGERPSRLSDNLQRFFSGNRYLAQQAYTTAIAIIKQILERYRDEVETVIENSN